MKLVDFVGIFEGISAEAEHTDHSVSWLGIIYWRVNGKMRKFHKWLWEQQTIDFLTRICRICLTSFSEKWIWNEGIALDLFHVDSMPRLHLFRWFVNPRLDALKNRWHLTSFIGCNTVFIALLDDGVNYLDLTQEITKNPPINRHFRLLHDIWVWSRWFTEIFCHPGLCLLQRSVALWLCLGGESSAMVVVGECSSPCRKYGLTPWKLVCHT